MTTSTGGIGRSGGEGSTSRYFSLTQPQTASTQSRRRPQRQTGFILDTRTTTNASRTPATATTTTRDQQQTTRGDTAALMTIGSSAGPFDSTSTFALDSSSFLGQSTSALTSSRFMQEMEATGQAATSAASDTSMANGATDATTMRGGEKSDIDPILSPANAVIGGGGASSLATMTATTRKHEPEVKVDDATHPSSSRTPAASSSTSRSCPPTFDFLNPSQRTQQRRSRDRRAQRPSQQQEQQRQARSSRDSDLPSTLFQLQPRRQQQQQQQQVVESLTPLELSGLSVPDPNLSALNAFTIDPPGGARVRSQQQQQPQRSRPSGAQHQPTHGIVSSRLRNPATTIGGAGTVPAATRPAAPFLSRLSLAPTLPQTNMAPPFEAQQEVAMQPEQQQEFPPFEMIQDEPMNNEEYFDEEAEQQRQQQQQQAMDEENADIQQPQQVQLLGDSSIEGVQQGMVLPYQVSLDLMQQPLSRAEELRQRALLMQMQVLYHHSQMLGHADESCQVAAERRAQFRQRLVEVQQNFHRIMQEAQLQQEELANYQHQQLQQQEQYVIPSVASASHHRGYQRQSGTGTASNSIGQQQRLAQQRSRVSRSAHISLASLPLPRTRGVGQATAQQHTRGSGGQEMA